MINLCPLPPSLIMSDEWGNQTRDTPESWYNSTVLRMILLSACTCVVCICGLVGNGTVIWLLGFRIKRNPFSTYILNLAVADFGVLIASLVMAITTIVYMHIFVSNHLRPPQFQVYLFYGYFLSPFFFFFYSTSQFLLTTISTDRCLSVLFPLWYRCHRPKNFSIVLCALMWLLTLVIHGICLSVHFSGTFDAYYPLFVEILVNAMVCLPLTTVSTLILFVRLCFKSQQRKRGRLLMAVLLTLFFFLIFAFPLNIIYLIEFSPLSSFADHLNVRCYNGPEYGLLCASLNSFVNPLLYFLVGRNKRGLCRENLKHILQRVFTEEKEAILTCPPGSNTGDATGMTTTKQMKKNSTEEPGTQLSDLQKPLP